MKINEVTTKTISCELTEKEMRAVGALIGGQTNPMFEEAKINHTTKELLLKMHCKLFDVLFDCDSRWGTK